MKVLKTILIVLAIIIAIPLITALFVKKTYSVERETFINKPRQEVFNYIKLLKNQNYYSVWSTLDPAMKQEYRGTDGMAGFVSAWESKEKNVGKGEQTITNIVDGERVDFDLHFMKPYEGKADAYMTTEAVSEIQTRVKWGFSSRMNYPMNLMLLFVNMENMIGDDLSTGLANLKSVMEKA